MKKSALRLNYFGWVAILPFVLSCNVYKPFASPGNDEEYREAAQACLHNSDYSCAVDYYNKLSDSGERDQDLCTVEMAQAGMTLSELVNVLSQGATQQKVFGTLANNFLPYTTDKGTAASDARTKCAALPVTGSHAKLNLLLQVVAYFVDCSTRMAATTVTQCSSSGVTVAGTGHSTVVSTDISPDVNGTYSSGPAMCDSDANACALDYYLALSSLTQIQGDGFDKIGSNVSSLQGPFTAIFGSSQPGVDAAAAQASRKFIRQTTTN